MTETGSIYISDIHKWQDTFISWLKGIGVGEEEAQRISFAYAMEKDSLGYCLTKPMDYQDLALMTGISLQLARRAFERLTP